MAKYTLELRELFTPIKINPPFFTREEVEGWFAEYKLEDYLTNEQIEVINTKGVWTKEKLAHKIVNHYFMREIGFETIQMFKQHVEFYMEELMEEYLPLIYSASIEYDPLINVNFHEYFTRKATNEENVDNTGRSSSNSNNNSSSLGVNSDTPQGQINKQTILGGQYASSTSATENESTISDTTNTTSNSKSDSETNEDYDRYQIGNSGVSATSQRLVLQYRDTIRALDREIIKKLNILFMGLY